MSSEDWGSRKILNITSFVTKSLQLLTLKFTFLHLFAFQIPSSHVLINSPFMINLLQDFGNNHRKQAIVVSFEKHATCGDKPLQATYKKQDTIVFDVNLLQNRSIIQKIPSIFVNCCYVHKDRTKVYIHCVELAILWESVFYIINDSSVLSIIHFPIQLMRILALTSSVENKNPKIRNYNTDPSLEILKALNKNPLRCGLSTLETF